MPDPDTACHGNARERASIGLRSIALRRRFGMSRLGISPCPVQTYELDIAKCDIKLKASRVCGISLATRYRYRLAGQRSLLMSSRDDRHLLMLQAVMRLISQVVISRADTKYAIGFYA
jgi:uncharacterized protein YfaA (DUF2138 family)